MPIRGLLFDFDGTLTRPDGIDFARLRQGIACPSDEPLLEFVAAQPDPAERRRLTQILDELEQEMAAASAPNAHAEEVLTALRWRYPLGIITRNSRAAVAISLQQFRTLRLEHFAVLVDRDGDFPPKPEPHGVLHAAAAMGLPPAEILLVGDFVFDIMAGQAAGTQTAYLSNGDPLPTFPQAPDHILTHLAELPAILG